MGWGISTTGKLFLASVGTYVGAKLYKNYVDSQREEEEGTGQYRTYISVAPRTVSLPPPERITVSPSPPRVIKKTPEELEAERAARIAAAWAQIKKDADSPTGRAWAAKMAQWDAKEAQIAAMKAAGTWRWWMNEELQGGIALLGMLWTLFMPIAWGLSMILTHGDWLNSALNGVESIFYVGMKIFGVVHRLILA